MVQQPTLGQDQREASLSHYYYTLLIGSSSLLIALAFANLTPHGLLAWCRSLFLTSSSSRRPRFVSKPHKRDSPGAKDSQQVGDNNEGKQPDKEVEGRQAAADEKTPIPTLASPPRRRRRPRNDDNMNDDKSSRMTPIRRPLVFPWEDLRHDDDENGASKRSSQRHSIMDAKPNMEDTRRTEQFLATLTFAQTGLRAPSCPCCR